MTAQATANAKPTACLALADGTLFYGHGFGATGETVAELVFNTAMTGYQEIMTDPSYAGQVVTFTFPHVGNVGVTDEDDETAEPVAAGMVVKWDPTEPSNWRAQGELTAWLAQKGRIGVGGIDTRRLTRAIRQQGAPHVALAHNPDGKFDLEALVAKARAWKGLVGLDLAKDVSCTQSYVWDEMRWAWPEGYTRRTGPGFKVVAVDYGAKRNILRCLASVGCEVVVLPATATGRAAITAPNRLSTVSMIRSQCSAAAVSRAAWPMRTRPPRSWASAAARRTKAAWSPKGTVAPLTPSRTSRAAAA